MSVLQTFVEENESVPFPQQGFDPVMALTTEEEQRRCERIQVELLLYYSCQAIDSFSHISVAAGDVDIPGYTYIT